MSLKAKSKPSSTHPKSQSRSPAHRPARRRRQAELDSSLPATILALEDEESDDAAGIEPIEDADALNAETIVPRKLSSRPPT